MQSIKELENLFLTDEIRPWSECRTNPTWNEFKFYFKQIWGKDDQWFELLQSDLPDTHYFSVLQKFIEFLPDLKMAPGQDTINRFKELAINEIYELSPIFQKPCKECFGPSPNGRGHRPQGGKLMVQDETGKRYYFERYFPGGGFLKVIGIKQCEYCQGQGYVKK